MKSFFVLSMLIAGQLCSPNELLYAQNQGGFAVVELFTSEGCSSCPPADEVAKELAAENISHVYILAFHVDYWDHLGWKDVYSDAAYSNRQQVYAHYFGVNNIYTPQAIVNGSSQLVGSDKKQLHNIIDEELRKKAAHSIVLKADLSNSKMVNVTYRIPGGTENSLNIALVQVGAQTDVHGGENQGKRLHHINIVREFKTLNQPVEQGHMVLSLPNGSVLDNFRVIAFLQNKNNWHITASTATPISD